MRKGEPMERRRQWRSDRRHWGSDQWRPNGDRTPATSERHWRTLFSLRGRRNHEGQADLHRCPCPGSRGPLPVPGSGRRSQLVSCLAARGPQRAERAARREDLIEEIREVFEASDQRYGAPRVQAELRDRGRGVSKRMAAKLLNENGVRPPRGKRRAPITTDSRHAYPIAPNLLDRNFEVRTPDTVWLADIPYIPTDEGWLSLAAVKGLATMEIVGWSMSERLKRTPCEDALKMAIGSRRPQRKA